MSTDQNAPAWASQQPGGYNQPQAYDQTPGGYQQQPGYQQPGYAQPAPAPARPSAGPAATLALFCIGGGAAVVLGSVLPFISNTTTATDLVEFNLNPGARVTSVIFGAILILRGVLVRRSLAGPTVRPGNGRGLAIALTIASVLGTLGYLTFMVIGLAGVTETDDFGDAYKVTWSPSIGLILCIIGCAVAAYGAIRLLTSSRSAQPGPLAAPFQPGQYPQAPYQQGQYQQAPFQPGQYPQAPYQQGQWPQ